MPVGGQNPAFSTTVSFSGIKRKRPINPNDSWRAPEHMKMTKDMRRVYVYGSNGTKVSTKRILLLDPRPTILVPPRPTRAGWL